MIGLYRFLLALGVAFAHAGQFTHGPSRTFVSAFFILSGYLITLTLNVNYSGVLAPFYWNRFLRIYPFHLATMVLALVVLHPDYSYIPGALLLIPPQAGAINVPTWSLGFEVLFYALAPFVVYRLRSIMAVFVLSLVYLAYNGAIAHLAEGFMATGDMFGSTAVALSMLHFMLGAFIYHMRRWAFPQWPLIVAFLVTINFARYDSYESQVHIGVIVCSLLLLLTWTKEAKWSKYLGELCYPIYLSHWALFHVFPGKLAIPVSVVIAMGWVFIENRFIRTARAKTHDLNLDNPVLNDRGGHVLGRSSA